MIISTPRGRATVEAGIVFPSLQSWNPVTRQATIVAQVDGKRVMCRVADTDLQKKYKPEGSDPMQTVTRYRSHLERAARRLIESETFEEDGSVLIHYRDLQ